MKEKLLVSLIFIFSIKGLYAQSLFGEQNKIEAEEHFKKGVILMQQENWEGALVEFEESLKLYPTKSALFNKGMCLKALHRYIEALTIFEEYLERYGNEIDDARRKEVLENIEEIRALIGKLELVVNVDGAQIYINDKKVGESPLKEPIILASGVYKLRVERSGYETYQREIEIIAGKTKSLEVHLIKLKETGTLKLASNIVGAKVIIDGKEVGVTPLEIELPKGKHSIEVSYKGYNKATQGIIIEPRKENELFISLTKLEAQRKIHKGYFWTTTSITIATTLATIGLGTSVVVLNEDFEKEPTQDLYDKGRSLMTATDVTLGIAIASGITSLVLFFFTDWGKEEKKGEAPETKEASIYPLKGGTLSF